MLLLKKVDRLSLSMQCMGMMFMQLQLECKSAA